MSLTGSASMTNELQGSVESGGEVRGKLAGLRFIQGLSAFEVAVINGFSGTEEEWLASLKGEPGKPGYTPVKGKDYSDGEKGDPFTYEDFTPEQLAALKGAPGYTPVKNKDYFDGEDGYSPNVSVTDIAGGKRVAITDENGTKTFDLKDGADGYTPVKGKDYFDGDDGDTIVSVIRTAGNGAAGTTDTYTGWLSSGNTFTFTVYNGKDGKGEKGDTPTKGVDYYTAAEKQAFADEVREAVLKNIVAAKIGEAVLPASAWTGSGNLYSQVVSINGVTANSQVDLTPSVEQLAIFYEKDLTFVTENEDGVVTVYAIGQKPTNDYTIQVTITEVNV